MSYTTLENTAISIDLKVAGNSRGWIVDGTDAVHETCNAGEILLSTYPIVPGLQYQFSYQIKSINSGYVQPRLGGAVSANQTTTGYKTATITAVNANPLSFFSNANARISVFDIKLITEVNILKSEDTIAWDEVNNKWAGFRTYNPECGFSLFANMFTCKDGRWYVHQLSNVANNFYGEQYDSIFKFVSNVQEAQPKTFESLSYDANQLLITTVDGITTSLGQISELIDVDFLKTILDDGVDTVNIYDSEGIYSAGFMRDKNTDIVNGDVLKGTYIMVELKTIGNGQLRLHNVLVNSVNSPIGSR